MITVSAHPHTYTPTRTVVAHTICALPASAAQFYCYKNGAFLQFHTFLPEKFSIPPSQNKREMSSLMPVFPKPAGADSGGATTEPTVSKQHRRPTSLPRVVSVLSEWKNAAENASEKTRQRRHCARKFGSFPRGLSTPAENKIRRRRLRGSRPHWFAMIGFSSARHADSDCARVASSPSYFLPRWSPPRQSGEIPPR